FPQNFSQAGICIFLEKRYFSLNLLIMGIKSSSFRTARYLPSLLTLWFAAPAPAAETAIEAWVQRSAGVPPASARADGSNNIIVERSGVYGGGRLLVIRYTYSCC